MLDGVRTRWAPYPIGTWHEAGVSGQLLASIVRSPQLANERTVLLYLPASYDSGQKRYPVVYLLHGMGIETGVDLDKLIDAAFFISDFLGRPPVSRVANAMRKRRKPARAAE